MSGGYTYSGTWTNTVETLTAFPAMNGVRHIVDLDALGDVTITAWAPVLEDSSFSVWFKNVGRNTLTITGGTFQSPDGSEDTTVSTRVKHGVLGYTYKSGKWLLSNWISFTAPMGVIAAVQWIPQNTNGACVIEDQIGVVSVTRTGEGLYTIVTEEPISSVDLVQFVPYVQGLPDENSAEVIVISFVGTSVDINVGIRNKNGQFADSDLLQNVANRITSIISVLP